MEKTGILRAYSSRTDKFGNRYWAFQYEDCKTGKIVNGKITGGEMNIYGILRNWNNPNDWDRSVSFHNTELPIRQFDSMVKDWEYAGCTSQELAKFIRSKLAE